MTIMTKDFIVAINFASKHGAYSPKKQREQAYKEFGEFADEKLGDKAPNGLTGVWWDEIKQFVEPNIINWSFTKKL